MASEISNFVFACVILLVVRNSATKTLVPKCDYECKAQDLETGGDYFASGSAISSQFLMPDGSVLTNSKETSISSDGIKQTFHELKKEADRFVQTGQGGSAIHSHLPSFGSIPTNFGIPSLPKLSVPVSYYTAGHESYSQSAKDQELANKVIHSLSPSTSNQYGQVQAQHSEQHVHANSHIPCDICSINSGRSNSENTASYNTIVGNVAPASESHSTHLKYESSAQKNSSYQSQPVVPFSNIIKPNTFTTNFIDLNSANRHHLNTGTGSESHVNYQEQGSSQIKNEERVISQPVYGGGPVAHPSRVVVSVNGPSAVNSHVYEKQQSSSHVQAAAQNPSFIPAAAIAQQSEAELSKQHQSNVFRSPVLLEGVPQSVPLDQHAGSYQSSHSSYYSSSSSSSSSKGVSTGDELSPIVVHQVVPQKISASNGYSSSSSSSSGSSGSYSQGAPEVYYNGNRIHGASSSIYDHNRGDQITANANAETLCTTCTFVAAGAPVKNTYGVATSYSSQSSTINGKTTENREAAVAVNDNGKVDRYHVKT